jgi:hypothetical protein
MMKPTGAPSWGNVPQMARLPCGAFSVASSAAPDHSPPRPTPWQKRSSTRNSGARIIHPGVSAVGSRPIRKVPMPMMSSEAISVFLRPIRSPKWPKRTEPIGRATKATPNTAKELSSCVVEVWCGKNRAGKTSEDAVAYE